MWTKHEGKECCRCTRSVYGRFWCPPVLSWTTLFVQDKTGVLALFMGGFGVHRFYLGQTGLGIFYLIFCWFPIIWVVGLIDAIVFFSMTKDDFDYKYNRQYLHLEREEEWESRRDRRDEYRQRRREYRREYRREQVDRKVSPPPPAPAPPRSNPYKQSGIKKYKDYDYDGAIEDFEKALEIEPKDIAIHFNLACAYSLNENAERSFYHLDQSVALGFDDFQKIKAHDALAYLRIQPQFEEFEQNNFRLIPQLEAPKENLLDSSNDLLEQLQKLGELREKGLLSQEEFAAQKKKLLEG